MAAMDDPFSGEFEPVPRQFGGAYIPPKAPVAKAPPSSVLPPISSGPSSTGSYDSPRAPQVPINLPSAFDAPRAYFPSSSVEKGVGPTEGAIPYQPYKPILGYVPPPQPTSKSLPSEGIPAPVETPKPPTEEDRTQWLNKAITDHYATPLKVRVYVVLYAGRAFFAASWILLAWLYYKEGQRWERCSDYVHGYMFGACMLSVETQEGHRVGPLAESVFSGGDHQRFAHPIRALEYVCSSEYTGSDANHACYRGDH